jgi:hypothetical protein
MEAGHSPYEWVSTMKLPKLLAIGSLFAFLAPLTGCEGDDANQGPFGKPSESALLSPFAGAWVFDFDRTLDAQKAAGASDEELRHLRELRAQNPQVAKMHADLTITGNEAVGSGAPSCEYRFFGLHRHDAKVCGKAWHHEDRFDPGDMSKCYVRLSQLENVLRLEVRMQEESPALDDPELKSSPPVELDSAAHCDADKPAGGKWSEWTTYVFARRQ